MKKGFTLIETMVAVTIFVIAALIIAGVTLNIVESLRRALAMKSIIDNLSFAMESMTIELREGDGYQIFPGQANCGEEAFVERVQTCDPDDALRFRNSAGKFVFFERGITPDGNGKRWLGRCETSPDNPVCQGDTYSPVTSPTLIDIKSLNFELVDPPANGVPAGFKRSYIRISVVAEAEAGPGKKTTFQLQTVASQRNIRQ